MPDKLAPWLQAASWPGTLASSPPPPLDSTAPQHQQPPKPATSDRHPWTSSSPPPTQDQGRPPTPKKEPRLPRWLLYRRSSAHPSSTVGRRSSVAYRLSNLYRSTAVLAALLPGCGHGPVSRAACCVLRLCAACCVLRVVCPSQSAANNASEATRSPQRATDS
jgi:hypothetical protein